MFKSCVVSVVPLEIPRLPAISSDWVTVGFWLGPVVLVLSVVTCWRWPASWLPSRSTDWVSYYFVARGEEFCLFSKRVPFEANWNILLLRSWSPEPCSRIFNFFFDCLLVPRILFGMYLFLRSMSTSTRVKSHEIAGNFWAQVCRSISTRLTLLLTVSFGSF